MIVAMKKLQVLLYHAEREAFLAGLARVGVVHVVEKEEIGSDVLEKATGALKRCRRVLAGLDAAAKGLKQPASPREILEADAVAQRFEELEASRDKASQSIVALKKDAAALEPWGDFDPQNIERLSKAGIRVRFFECADKTFQALKLADIPHEVITSGSTVRFVVFDNGTTDVGDYEVTLPAASISATRREIERKEKETAEIAASIAALTAQRPALREAIAGLEQTERFETARLSFEEGAAGKVLALTGWLPAAREKAVTEFLSGHTVWSEITVATPGDAPPVQMHNGPIARLYEPITKLFALPDYFEIDTTPFLAPFFTFYFGLCLGDLGYGAVIFLGALAAFVKGPASFKPFAKLVMILGATTMVCGLLLNSVFGCLIFDMAGDTSGIFSSGGGIAMLGPYFHEGNQKFPAMTFALYIAFVQLLLGIILQTVNRIRMSGNWLQSLWPLSTILMMTGVTF